MERACQYCGESVAEGVAKCAQCGEWLVDRDPVDQGEPPPGFSAAPILLAVLVLCIVLAASTVAFLGARHTAQRRAPLPPAPGVAPRGGLDSQLLAGKGVHLDADGLSVAAQNQQGDVVVRTVDVADSTRLPPLDDTLWAPTARGEVLYFTSRAGGIDYTLDPRTLDQTAKSLSQHGYVAKPISRGLAVVYAELDMDEFYGVGIHVGPRFTDVCVSQRASPVLEFSTVRGSDWLAERVRSGADPRQAARELAEYIWEGIAANLKTEHPFPKPVQVACAGSGASPTLAQAFALTAAMSPIPVETARVVDDPLTSCVRGALVAAAAD